MGKKREASMREDMEEAPATAASESSLTIPRPVKNTGVSTGEGESGVPSADVESTARDAGTNSIDGGACPKSPEHPSPPPSRLARRGIIRSVEEMLRRRVPLLPRGRKLRVLDLCSGSCTLMDALRQYMATIRYRFEYVSVDVNPWVGPRVNGHKHICGDVRDWREIIASRYKLGHFDIVWASPPCTVFSRAKTGTAPAE